MNDTLTQLRGQYEEAYDSKILSTDIIETLVHEFSMSAQWLKNVTQEDIIDESRKLRKTLTFSSNYNQKDK